MPLLEDRLKPLGGKRGHILLHAYEIFDIELSAGVEHLANSRHAEWQRPSVVAQRNRIILRKYVVVGRGDVVPRRIEFERQFIGPPISLPFVSAVFSGHGQQAIPAFANRREPARSEEHTSELQ